MVTTLIPSHLYNLDDDTIELTEKEKNEKESETDYKLKFVSYALLSGTNNLIAYSSLQATKFALFSHFTEDENHSSTIDFPPEIA